MRLFRGLVGATAVAALLLSAGQAAAAGERKDEAVPFGEIIQFLQFQHKDGLTEEELTEAALAGLFGALDPHTYYVPPERFEAFKSEYMPVQEKPVTDDDIETDGLESSSTEDGDVLEDDGSTDVNGGDPPDGAEGPTGAVWGGMLAEGVGYIRLKSFTDDTDDRFVERLAELKSNGPLRTLLLDLRENPGGSIEAAVNVAKSFIDKGIVYYAVGQDGITKPTTVLDGEKAAFRTIALVDGGSASASELLAGALRDRANATLFGETTYGKGSMQHVFGLSNGGGLAVTVAEYVTPDKTPIHGVGLAPDRRVEGAAAQLLVGVREAAGDVVVEAAADEGSLTVNGMQVAETLPWFVAEGRVYAPLRALAAMTGGDVRWSADMEGGAAIVTLGDVETAYSSRNGRLVVREGVGYVDAAASFPQLRVEMSGGALRLAMEGAPRLNAGGGMR